MAEELLERLRSHCQAVGVDLGQVEERLLLRFLGLLEAANLQMNLTAIRDPREAVMKHLADSLAGLAWVREHGGAVVDVGSGGGLPGVPLAICCPGQKFVLLEASQKKAGYLESTVARLGLNNVRVRWGRAEAEGRAEGRESFGVALIRAVAPLAVVYEYCLPLLHLGGILVAWRGRRAAAEVEVAARALEILGGGGVWLYGYQFPGAGERYLVVVEKGGPTPPRFPRRVGVPARHPLGER